MPPTTPPPTPPPLPKVPLPPPPPLPSRPSTAPAPPPKAEVKKKKRKVSVDVFDGAGRWMGLWHGLEACVALYCFITVSLRIAFYTPFSPAWLATDILSDILLTADILVRFNTVPDRSILPLPSRSQISRSYLRRGFWLDALAALPLQVFLPTVRTSPWAYALRLNSTLKALRLTGYLDLAHTHLPALRPALLSLLKAVVRLLLLVHLFACAFLLVLQAERSLPPSTAFLAGPNPLNLSLPAAYLRAFYWSLATTTGFDNTEPVTTLEVGLSLVASLAGIAVYVNVVGVFGSLLSDLDASNAAFSAKMSAIADFLKYRRLDPALASQIRAYYAYLWASGLSASHTLDDLAPDIALEVALDSCSDIVQKVDLFQGVDEQFIHAIVLRLQPRVSLPGFYIIRKGEVGKEMFFISKGSVDVVTEEGKVIVSLSSGSFFGEIALITNTARNASIRAGTHCDLFVLTKTDFDQVMAAYPQQRGKVMEVAEQRLAKLRPPPPPAPEDEEKPPEQNVQ